MHGKLDGDVHTLYRDLALSQRGAYNAFLDLGRFVIASASPELFFERRGDQVLLRPMKGTIARGRDLHHDHALALALRSNDKERAENVMIVDLMRNDVARVARTGSVQVPRTADRRTLHHRPPTHLGRDCRPAPRHRFAGVVPRAVPARISHRRPETELHGVDL